MVLDDLTVVRTWAERWRSLRAWGRPLDEVTITVKRRPNGGITGTGLARPVKRQVIVRVGSSLVDGLVTVLHELAHVAVPAQEHHGDRWQAAYAAAVEEVTGIPVAYGGEKADLDYAAHLALRSWWRSSGNEFLWKLAGGKRA
jgi:hypothetical protein